MTEKDQVAPLLPRGRPRSRPSQSQGKPPVHHLRAYAHRVTRAQTGRFTIGELCHDFGISRKTGHKYLNAI